MLHLERAFVDTETISDNCTRHCQQLLRVCVTIYDIDQPTNQSTNQSINQSINQPIKTHCNIAPCVATESEPLRGTTKPD